MQDLARIFRMTRRARPASALLAAVCLASASPALAAPAPLPDWDAAKKQPAPLPDWGVDDKPAKKTGKKPRPKPADSETTAAPAETPAPEQTPAGEAAPAETPAAETPASETTPVEAPPVEPAPVAASPEPEPEPEGPAAPAQVDVDKKAQLRRNARGELIAGSVLLVGGLAGLGVLAGGIFIKRAADEELEEGEGMSEEMLAPLNDQKKQGETMMAAGAISGAIGVALGAALLGIGARDLKASRARQTARVRVAPSLGGLVVFGRF